MPGWPSELAPGEVGEFEVEFNTSGKSSHQTKSITVTSSDPNNGQFNFKLSGDVFLPLEILPQTLSFRSALNEAVEKTAEFKNNTKQKVTITDIKAQDADTSNMMNITMDKKVVNAGESAIITVSCSGKEAGRFFKNFVLTTNYEAMKTLTLRVNAYVDDPNAVKADPQQPQQTGHN